MFVSISEAKPHLAALIERSEAEDVILTRHGKPTAVIIASDRFEELLNRLEDAEDALAVHNAKGEPTVSADDLFASLGLAQTPARV